MGHSTVSCDHIVEHRNDNDTSVNLVQKHERNTYIGGQGHVAAGQTTSLYFRY